MIPIHSPNGLWILKSGLDTIHNLMKHLAESSSFRKSIILLTLLSQNIAGQAQLTIVSYEMEKSTITETRPGNVVNGNVSADNLTAGSGINPKDEGSGQWAWRDWGTGIATADSALASNKFWSWGFNVTGNVDIDLTTLDISVDKTLRGPDDFEIRAAVNGGGSSTVFTHDFAGSFGSAVDFANVDLSGFASLQNLTLGDSVEFTLIAFNGTGGTGGNLGIVNEGTFADGDGLVISGTVSPVPEPLEFSIITAVALAGLAYRRRRHQTDA